MAVLFLQWIYVDAPRTYIGYLSRTFATVYEYFSINFLLKTLFEPWRHDAVSLVNLPLNLWFQAFVQNLISRTIGLIVRTITILSGIGFLFVFVLGSALFLIAWYLLPLLMIFSIMYGFQLLLGGLNG